MWILPKKSDSYDQRDEKGNLVRSFGIEPNDKPVSTIKEVGEYFVSRGSAEEVPSPHEQAAAPTPAEEPKSRGRR
jgi:hypothetical protein